MLMMRDGRVQDSLAEVSGLLTVSQTDVGDGAVGFAWWTVAGGGPQVEERRVDSAVAAPDRSFGLRPQVHAAS